MQSEFNQQTTIATTISFTMANRLSDPTVQRSRPNRSRQSSSLSAMMAIQEDDKPELHHPSSPETTGRSLAAPKSPSAPEEEMLLIARRLRRAKRSLFLKSVEAPASPVDKFRSIVMNLSQQDTRNLPALPFKATTSQV